MLPDPPDAAKLPCADGINALRALVRAYIRDGPDGAPDERWRLPARVVAHDARARGVQVEELIISLKRSWNDVADRERLPRTESSRLLARVVTHCVKEYYAPWG
jgi:hypothetical protein